MKCHICRKNTDHLVCERCWQNALEQLNNFPNQYGALEEELFPQRGYGQRVSGTRTPPLPVRLETLYLRTGGMSTPLIKHEVRIREAQSHTKMTFRGEEINRITQNTQYLKTHEEWIFKNYTDLDNLTKEILSIAQKVNYVLGFKSDEIFIGTCPTQDTNGEICGAKLRIDPKILETYADIRCRRCHTVWTSEQWRLLGRIIESDNAKASGKDLQGTPDNDLQMDNLQRNQT